MLIYLTEGEFTERNGIGIYNKVLSQCEAFERSGLQTEWVQLPYHSKLYRLLPFTSATVKWKTFDLSKDVDCIYIRYRPSDREFISMLKRLKRQNPNLKLIIEISSFPYDGEWILPKAFMIMIKDKIYRRQLHKYVDRIVIFSGDKCVFGIPTIRTINGINVDSIRVRTDKCNSDSISLIAVAALRKWHGYDRILRGIGEYYKSGGKRNIHFHIVGDGKILNKYQQIVKELSIEDHCTFHGFQKGESLDEIYNQCRIGVESFGWHRTGVQVSSSLKSREYLAKGIPVIAGCDIDILKKENPPYYCQFPSDDTPINIERLIKFYDDIYLYSGKTKKEIIDEIREFAYRHCDMSIAMKPVVEYIYN